MSSSAEIRLLFVVEQATPSPQYGGLFSHFAKNGVQIFVFNFLEGIEFRDQVDPMTTEYRSLQAGQSYYKAISALKAYQKAVVPHIMHCQEFIPSFYAGFSIKSGVKSIYHRRHNYTTGFGQKLMDQWAVMKHTKTIAVCRSMAEVSRKEHPFFKSKIEHRTNAINLQVNENELRRREEEKLSTLPGKKLILLLARLRTGKGHNIALDVLKKLNATSQNFHLVFAGDGPEEAAIRSMVESADLASQVTFLGDVQNVDLVIKKAFCMLVPSSMEAFPKTPLEAMAYGTPVVAHAVGGIVESIIDRETGFLVAPGDVGSMCHIVNELEADDHLRKSIVENGKKRVERHYTTDIMAAEFVELYRDLIDGSRKG